MKNKLPADEILDLVDENDQIIGEVEKSKANSDHKLLHREVRILIYDDNNKLLLQQRSFKKKVYPGVWAITAGHVSKGVDPFATAHIELKEELGFDTNLQFLFKRLVSTSNESHFAYCYIGRYAGEEIIIEPREVEQVKFYTKDEFVKLFYDDWNKAEYTDDKLDLDLCMGFWEGKYGIST